MLRVWPFQRCQNFPNVSALVYSLYGIFTHSAGFREYLEA